MEVPDYAPRTLRSTRRCQGRRGQRRGAETPLGNVRRDGGFRFWWSSHPFVARLRRGRRHFRVRDRCGRDRFGRGPHGQHGPARGRRPDRGPSSHGRGHPECGCDPGRGGRSRARGDHPCGGSSHHAHGEAKCCGGEESGRGRGECHGHGRHQNQSARKRKEESWPTADSILASVRTLLSQLTRTSIFKRSSRPMRLLCISWYASSASRRLSYSTKAKLEGCELEYYCRHALVSVLTAC